MWKRRPSSPGCWTSSHLASLLFLLLSSAGLPVSLGRQPCSRSAISVHRTRVLLQAASPEPRYVNYTEGTAIEPSGQPDDGTSGVLLFPSTRPLGDAVLRSFNDSALPNLATCVTACRALPPCNVFAFCPEASCADELNATVPFGGCQLAFQNQTAAPIGRPTLVYPAVGLVGGALLNVAASTLPGYTALPGVSFFSAYSYNCEGTLDKERGNCVLAGPPEDIARRCTADPSCRAFTYYPQGRENRTFPLGFLKGGSGVMSLELQLATFNPNSIIYLNQSPPPGGSSSGGALRGGAIAGIVVGACAGLALIAASGFFLLKRRGSKAAQTKVEQPQQQQQGAVQLGRQPADPQQVGEDPLALERAGPSLDSDSQLFEASPASKGTLHSAEKLSDSAEDPPPARHPHISLRLHPTMLSTFAPAAGGKALSDRSQPQLEAPPSLTSPRSSANSSEVLCRIQSYSDEPLIEFSSIEFCRNEDGSIVELGSGAFSTVYRVMLDDVQPHAAKVLRLGDHPGQLDNFVREASLLRQLRHRNIILYTGACVQEEEKRGIILMELMEGRSLHDKLQVVNKAGHRLFAYYNRGKLVLLDVARGLAYLHSRSLTHFDVKSSNVLLSRDLTAKLADCGFTKLLKNTHHSISHHTPGTFDYMAPELLMGRHCTNSVDIYSFGVLAWELCTGVYPSRGCLRELRVPQEAPAPVAELVSRCMEEDPACRPSARDIVEFLSRRA